MHCISVVDTVPSSGWWFRNPVQNLAALSEEGLKHTDFKYPESPNHETHKLCQKQHKVTKNFNKSFCYLRFKSVEKLEQQSKTILVTGLGGL
jgi:hypothetical protein